MKFKTQYFVLVFLKLYSISSKTYTFQEAKIREKVLSKRLFIKMLNTTSLRLWPNCDLRFSKKVAKIWQNVPFDLKFTKRSINFEMYFWYLQFSQKMKEKIRLYYYGTSAQVELFSFVFWENWRHHFEINWPLVNVKSTWRFRPIHRKPEIYLLASCIS